MAIVSCSLNKNLLRKDSCSYSLPEVKDIYLANFTDIVSAPVDYDCESGVTVSAITLASGASFYHIEPAKNSVTFTDEPSRRTVDPVSPASASNTRLSGVVAMLS